MPVSIADLFVSVSADVSGAQAGLSSLSKQLGDTTNSFLRAAPAALVLSGAGAAVGAGLASAVGVAASFEKQMSGVRAVMAPGDVKQFGSALDDLALSLGAETSFSAQQAAAGIEELIKAGIPAQAVLEGAGKAALSLAAATGTDVATSATIAAQAMNAFKIPVSELPTIVDRLAGVTNVSAADMSDLKFGMQAAGAVAATVGLSFEDTAAAIGIFANNGLRGQDAGTSLKTMLINLVPNTKQQATAFKQLGLITADGANAFFDAQGHVKSLAQISGTLQNALKGMTDQQKLATLQVLFGTDAMRAAAILAKTGADGVNEFVDQVRQVSAADQAAERLNNFLGRLEQLGGSLQTVQITIGRFFTPALGAIADTVKDVLNAFSGMSSEAKGIVTAVVSIAGAAALAIGGFITLAPVVAALSPAFTLLGGALAAVAPIFLVAAGAAAVLFAAWQANLFGIRDVVQGAFDAIPSILDQVGKAFAEIGPIWENNILPAILTIGNAIERTLIPVFNELVVTVLPVVQRFGASIADKLGGAFKAITSNPFFTNFALAVQKAFSGNVSGAVDTFIATIGALVPGLGSLIQNVRTTISGFADQIGPILGNFGLVFQKVFSGDIGGALDTFRAIIVAAIPGSAGFVDLVGRIADTVGRFAGNIGAGLLTFFTETLPPIVETIGQFAGDIGAGLLAFFNDTILPIAAAAASFAGDVGSGLTTFFTVTLPPILAQIGSFAGGIGDAMLAFFRDNLPVIASAAASFVGDIGSGLTTFFTVTLPPIVTAIASFTTDATAPLIQFFGEQIPSVIDTLGKFSGDVGTGIFTFFTQTLPPIIASAGTVTQDTFSAVVDFFQNKAPIIIDGAAKFNASQGAQLSPLSAFFAQFDDIKTQVQSLEPLFGSINSFGTSLDNLQQAVTNLVARSFGSLLKPEFDLFSNTLKNFADTAAPVQPALDSIGTTVETLGQKLSGVTEFINNGAKAIQGLADSLNALPADKLPGAGTGTGGFGLNPDLFNGNANPSTDIFKRTAFNPNGSGAGGGPVLNFNAPVSINGAGDLSDFAQAIADAIDASTRRVNAPPDNSGFPPLATSFV